MYKKIVSHAKMASIKGQIRKIPTLCAFIVFGIMEDFCREELFQLEHRPKHSNCSIEPEQRLIIIDVISFEVNFSFEVDFIDYKR